MTTIRATLASFVFPSAAAAEPAAAATTTASSATTAHENRRLPTTITPLPSAGLRDRATIARGRMAHPGSGADRLRPTHGGWGTVFVPADSRRRVDAC